MVQSEQHVVYRLMAGGPKLTWKKPMEKDCSEWKLKTVDPQERSTWRLLCVQLANYLEGSPLMWMIPLYLHVNQKSNYEMMMILQFFRFLDNDC